MRETWNEIFLGCNLRGDTRSVHEYTSRDWQRSGRSDSSTPRRYDGYFSPQRTYRITEKKEIIIITITIRQTLIIVNVVWRPNDDTRVYTVNQIRKNPMRRTVIVIFWKRLSAWRDSIPLKSLVETALDAVNYYRDKTLSYGWLDGLEGLNFLQGLFENFRYMKAYEQYYRTRVKYVWKVFGIGTRILIKLSVPNIQSNTF